MFHVSLIAVPVRYRIVQAVFATFCLAGSWQASEAAVLHVVYALDSQAANVGEYLTAKALDSAIGANVPPSMIKNHYVPPDRMSEPAILEFVRDVPVGPDDTLMFVYVGHGAWRQDIGTFMTPSLSVGQELSATRMVQVIHGLRPRLGIVIFDCCNQEKITKSVRSQVYGQAPQAGQPQLSPLFEELFFRSSGHVLLVSSSPNEYAFVRGNFEGIPQASEPPRGPLFMSAFGKALEERKGQRLNWSQVTGQTQFYLDRYLDFMKSQYPQGIITLNDGTQVNQERQTIQLRFFR